MMAGRPVHDVDDEIVHCANKLLARLGPRAPQVDTLEDLGVKHFVLLYEHVTGQQIPGSDKLEKPFDRVRVGQLIIDSIEKDIFGMPMDHISGLGIEAGHRRMMSDLLEIFNSICTSDDKDSSRHSDGRNSLDMLSSPMREALLSLYDDVNFLAKSAMYPKARREVGGIPKDVHTQTLPVGMKSSTTSPVIWRDLFNRTAIRVKDKGGKQPLSVPRRANSVLWRTCHPRITCPTPQQPKTANPTAVDDLFRRTIRPHDTNQSVATSQTASLTSLEVHSGKPGQPKRITSRVTRQQSTALDTGGGRAPTQPEIPIQSHLMSSSRHMPSLFGDTARPQSPRHYGMLAKDGNTNLRLTDLQPCRDDHSELMSWAGGEASLVENGTRTHHQKPMKKVIKPKPVISSKLKRKCSTGSVSPGVFSGNFRSCSTSVGSMRTADRGNKESTDNRHKILGLTDDVKAIRARRKEITRQVTQLQTENHSLQRLEDLITKEIKLTNAIETRKLGRGITLL